MRFKILGLVALAALVAAMGTIGLSQKDKAYADAVPNPTATATATANVFTLSGFFSQDDSCPGFPTGCPASVQVTPAGNVTALVIAATTPCVVDANPAPSTAALGACAANPADTDPAVNGFGVDAAAAAAIDANTINNYWRLNLTVTVSCTVNTTMTVIYTQNAVSAQSQFTCTGTAPAALLAIGKIDQNGALRGATFALGSPGFATAAATMVTSGSSSATNPCLSNNNCATNPNNVNQNGLLPPAPSGGITLPLNTQLEIREIGAPSTCTLVEIKLGPATSTTVLPLSFPVVVSFDGTTWTVNSNGVLFGSVAGSRLDLTYVNSCAIPGGAVSANSSIAVVIGGGTFGLTNTTHVEIVPAPGSDNDARLDIRARDSNSTPLTNAHVTVLTDRGALALRADTTGPAPTGYDVIEPSPGSVYFGSNQRGDTCDQSPLLSSTAYSGNLTTPIFSGSRQIQDGYTNLDGIVSACLYVDDTLAPGITPGKANITVIIENPSPLLSTYYPIYAPQNLVLTAVVTVVGPPASIKVAASPTSVQCGEKSTITATVTDAVGQNVSDHTRVELVSNYGSTIGGTGATLGFPGTGPTNPISSSAAETFSGVATAFLLTSTEHVGPYEVVVATGGSVGGYPVGLQYPDSTTAFPSRELIYSVGAFSTAPVSAQVTVTCALPSVAAPVIPPIVAPRTGEGIRPPNTGDAGLADTSGGSLAFVLAGAVAFALAGVATLKFARR